MNGLISFFNGAVCHGCGMGVTIMVLLMLDVHVVRSKVVKIVILTRHEKYKSNLNCKIVKS
jgi:hypothetical protein